MTWSFFNLESWIIPQFLTMQIICICDLLMYKFSVVLAYRHFHGFDDAFCTIHKNHVYNILHHQKAPCEYCLIFLMLFIWWYRVVNYHQIQLRKHRISNVMLKVFCITKNFPVKVTSWWCFWRSVQLCTIFQW